MLPVTAISTASRAASMVSLVAVRPPRPAQFSALVVLATIVASLQPIMALAADSRGEAKAGAVRSERRSGPQAQKAPVASGESKALVRDLSIRGPIVPAAESTPGVGGLRVAIDPISGAKIRPEPEQLRDLGIESPRRATSAPLIVRFTDGSAIVYLEDRCLSYWVARIDDAGHVHGVCAGRAESAAHALRQGPGQVVPTVKVDR